MDSERYVEMLDEFLVAEVQNSSGYNQRTWFRSNVTHVQKFTVTSSSYKLYQCINLLNVKSVQDVCIISLELLTLMKLWCCYLIVFQ